MKFNSFTELITFIQHSEEAFNLIVETTTKNKFLTHLTGLYKPKFITLQEFNEKRTNQLDDELFPLIYNECQNYELSKKIFNTLKTFKKIKCHDDNYKLTEYYYDKYLNIHIFESTLDLTNFYTYQLSLPNIEEFIIETENVQNIMVKAAPSEIIELSYIANKISQLLDQGVNYDEIDLVVNPRYLNDLYYIFKMYNISIVQNYEYLIITSSEVRSFLINFDIDLLQGVNEQIKSKIISIINKYGIENKEFLRNVLKETKIRSSSGNEGLEIRPYANFNPDNYVFFVGFSELEFLLNYSNNKFLDDEILAKLDLPTSLDLMHQDRQHFLKKIKCCHNLNISYTKFLKGEEVSYNNFLKNLLIIENDIKPFDEEVRYSENFDQFYLKQLLFYYKKFKLIDDSLPLLYDNITLYPDYDNKPTAINSYQKPEQLRLSASSINMFYQCQYKFYLANILKVKVPTFSNIINIGNYVHHLLELLYSPKYDFNFKNIEELFSQSLEEFSFIGSAEKKSYTINKINTFIKELVRTIDIQHKRMKYDILETEMEFFEENSIDLGEGYSLVGKIDKVLRLKNSFIVIDYKSGSSKLKFNNLDHGIDLQNLIYFVLLKSVYPDLSFGGTYRQKVTPKFCKDEKEFDDLFLLCGYTNESKQTVDQIGLDSLRNIKLSKDGFAKNDLTFNEEQFKENLELVQEKIENVCSITTKGTFKLNPIKDESVNSCAYCPYEAICYKKNSDFERI